MELSEHIISGDDSELTEEEKVASCENLENTFYIKRYMKNDLNMLKELVDENTYRIFGNISIPDLLSLTFLTLVIRNREDNIVASLSIQNYPNLVILSYCDWPSWVYKQYRIKTLNTRNTMWIHLYLFVRRSKTHFNSLIKEVYKQYVHVTYIAMIIPPHCGSITGWLDEFGTRITPFMYASTQLVQKLLFIDRRDFIHQYKLRRACQEDNDDIVPLIDAYAPQFKELYGQFYPAFLAKKLSKQRSLIIAEFNTKVVAVLCLNTIVALDNLKDRYELETFYGLRKVHPMDERKDLQKMDKESPEYDSDLHLNVSENTLDDRDKRLEKQFGKSNHKDKSHHFIQILKKDSSHTQATLNRRSSVRVDFVDSGSSQSSMSLSSSSQSTSSKLTSSSKSSESFAEDSLVLDLKLLDDWSSESSKESGTIQEDVSHKFDTIALNKRISIQDKVTDGDMMAFHESISNIFRGLDDEYGPMALSSSMYAIRKSHAYLANISTTSHFLPTDLSISDYQGESNCFAIEIAVALPGHEGALQQLVTCSFQCYTKRDFCLFTIPTSQAGCPIMDMFVRIPPRPGEVHEDDLYVIYRGNCLGDISVRRGFYTDLAAIEDLIYTTHNPDELAWLVRENFDRQNSDLFVLTCSRAVVGFALVRMEQRYDFVRRNYELETYTDPMVHKPGCIGRIEFLVMSPVFQRVSSFFLSEMHRLSGFTLLTYYILPEDGWKYRHIAVNLADLIPIKPRKMADLYVDQASTLKTQTSLNALYISTLNLCSLPRKDVNHKIVIVGTSVTAMAFVEALLFNSSEQYKATFNNVFVVAPFNSMLPKKPKKVCSHFFVKCSYFDYRYLNQLGLKTHVNFVKGVMTHIKRPEKEIIIDDDRKLLYDYLFLFCGQQFYKPMLFKSVTKPNKKEQIDLAKYTNPVRQPLNVFIVNTEEDATVALRALKTILDLNAEQQTIIVYGRVIEAYCCLAALLEFGVLGTDLTFVECPAIKNEGFTFPYNVDKYIQETLVELGVKVISNYRLYDYLWNEKNRMITAAVFETYHNRKKVDCAAMFSFTEKIFSSRTFEAIHNAGLVFDGGLVINSDCSTLDKCIYAAGTLTKFSRRYYADHLYHNKFSSQEVGCTLGIAIRKKLIVDYDEHASLDLTFDWICGEAIKHTQYIKPKIQYCKLPGKLFYLYIRKPGVIMPSKFRQADNEYTTKNVFPTASYIDNKLRIAIFQGVDFITGNFESIKCNRGYFKLYLNQYSSVEGITCLSMERIEYFNLCQLYGKHEKMLNNLYQRFEYGMIDDLYSYFKQPWSSALYNAQYWFFEQEIRRVMMSLKDSNGKLLSMKLLNIFQNKNFKKLSRLEYQRIKGDYLAANYDTIIKDNLIRFLMQHTDFINVYAHPLAVRNALEGYADSVMFTQQ